MFNKVQANNDLRGVDSNDLSQSSILSSATTTTTGGCIFGNDQSVSAGGSGSIFGESAGKKTSSGSKNNTVDYTEYRVKKGDTLGKIAKNYNISLSELLDANPQIKNPNLISINQKINIPSKKQATEEQVQYGEYKVVKGDTLSKIAKKYNISLSELLKINPQIKNPDVISINQKINVPVSDNGGGFLKGILSKILNGVKSLFKSLFSFDSIKTNTDAQPNESVSNETEETKNTDGKAQTYYDVKRGDTLTAILRNNIGLSEKALKDANPDVDFNKLKSGQRIVIPEIKSLSESYNDETGASLLNTAQNYISAKGQRFDYCASAVKDILLQEGILTVRPDGDACDLEDDLDNCTNLEKIYVPKEELKNLPKGCILLWQNVQTKEEKQNETSPSKAFRTYGHICITNGNGGEISDHYNEAIIEHATHYAVYVPKKLSTSEREQQAISARQAYVESKNKTGDMQRGYLNSYISWAKAVLSDNNVSQSSLRDLVSRLEEVPKNNKSAYVKDLVDECNKLLPQVKARLK